MELKEWLGVLRQITDEAPSYWDGVEAVYKCQFCDGVLESGHFYDCPVQRILIAQREIEEAQ